MAKQTIETVGKTIVRLMAQRRDIDAKSAELKKEEDAAKELLLEMLDAQGIKSTAIEGSQFVLMEQQVPQVKDWAKFYAHIKKTGAFELLERRPASGPYRELLDQGKKVPGVESFMKRSISVRKAD